MSTGKRFEVLDSSRVVLINKFLIYIIMYKYTQVLDYSVGLNVGGGAGAHTGMAHGEGENFS